MSSWSSPEPEGLSRLRALALGGGLGFLALLHGLALVRTGGVMEYPLDDVYIHLAMAAQIAAGGYGVNEGEYASAVSSILWPLLLTPFAGTEAQRWLPLAWNAASVAANALLWAAILARAGYGAGRLALLGVLLAALGPVALNMAGVGFLGMEHGLHLTATLAVVLGLQVFLAEGRVGWILAAGIVAGPMLRFEGLAVSGVACGVLLVNGRAGAAIGLGALALAPVAGFMGLMTALGLDPLPNSVQAKFDGGLAGSAASPLRRRIAILVANLAYPVGLPMAVLALGGLAAALALRGTRARAALALGAVGLAHLVLGQMGWMLRYEVYALVFMAALALVLAGPFLARAGTGPALARAVAALALAGGLLHYGGMMLQAGPAAAQSIMLQQRQLARFVTGYLKGPVAVNDLGWVAWASPWPVLDLWGLASRQALAIRLSNPPRGWAGPLAEAAGVRVAMIYDSWLGRAVDPAWVRLGELVLEVRSAAVGDTRVAFYATLAADVPALAALLRDFAASLPQGARFDFADGIGG